MKAPQKAPQATKSPANAGPAAAGQGGSGGGMQARIGNSGVAERMGGGEPLPEKVRSSVESTTGGDLSRARVHKGPQAAEVAASHGAAAVAIGEDIYVGIGGDSEEVLAHEAAHVVQQSAGGGGTPGTPGKKGGAGHEREADAVADQLGVATPSKQEVSAAPTGPQKAPSPELAAAVRKDIDTWYDTQIDYADSTRRWQSLNYTQFISSTGGNFFLSWTEGQMMNIISNLVGEVAGLLAPVAAGAIIGSAITPGIGTAIGAIVGFLVGAIWGAISTAISNREAQEQVDKALRGTGQQIQANENEFSDKAVASRGRARQIRDFMKGLVDNPDHTDADITSWRTFVKGETATLTANPPPNRGNRDLADSMIKEWVLQHAGDEEDENKETNSASWDKNREDAFGKGTDLDNHPEIFAKQSKYEWGKIGVPHQATTERWEADLGSMNADTAQSTYQGKQVTFRSTSNPDGFIEYIDKNLGAGMSLAPEGKENIRKNQFKLRPTMDLSKSDGSVYVNEWEYAFELTGPLPSNLTRTASFDVSPD